MIIPLFNFWNINVDKVGIKLLRKLFSIILISKKMQKILPVLFSLSMISAPALALGWGDDGNCPSYKNKVSQEQTEQVEESNK